MPTSGVAGPDHPGRSHGVGRVLRPPGPSRLRARPGRTRPFRFQPGALQQRTRWVGAGLRPPSVSPFRRRSRLAELPLRCKTGEPYADTQFPVAAIDELSKQGVPDVNFGGLPTPNPTLKALSDLASQVNGAVLMGHSQSGPFPLAAALLNPAVAKGLVLVEPGRCPGNYTDDQIKALAGIPVLVVFGDYRATWTGMGSTTEHFWQLSFDSCQTLIGRLKAAGGQAGSLPKVPPLASRRELSLAAIT
jgi:hypothetical protein